MGEEGDDMALEELAQVIEQMGGGDIEGLAQALVQSEEEPNLEEMLQGGMVPEEEIPEEVM